ncbi:hypothetical protein [Methylobacterium aquaticum]|jgi:hypothetical protein|uniref:hypothetical protein n=1 Tax=Methylobacterium aquaticum TaxID=270351 RepID=UPI000A599D99|nr:hypothetical protein [Methylobacterium aquaticum]
MVLSTNTPQTGLRANLEAILASMNAEMNSLTDLAARRVVAECIEDVQAAIDDLPPGA